MVAQNQGRELVQPVAGLTVRVISDIVTYKAVSEDTNGAYSLFETRTPPDGGVPPHYQQHEEEAFFVLEGAYAFQRGEESLVVGPGNFILIPRGVVHSFKNIGNEEARMLILASPAGYHEQFFLEAGDQIENPEHPEPPAGPPDFDRVLAAAARHGIVILPPPSQ